MEARDSAANSKPNSQGDEKASDLLSRRDVVGKLAAGAAGAAVVVLAANAVRVEAATHPGGPTKSVAPSGAASAATIPLAAAVPSATDIGVTDAGHPSTKEPSSAPWAILQPLTLGATLGDGWKISELTGVVDGTCVVTLQNERGRAQRVHLCRNDGAPRGLVFTGQLDLVAMNGGQGDLPTEEGFGHAVAELAHVLAANERTADGRRIVAALLPHAQRLDLFSGHEDRRLR